MLTNRNLKTRFGLVVVAVVALIAVGCSGDDNPAGNGSNPGPNPQNFDEITVNLSSINVKYDCDFDPIGITQPGDFHFRLNVDTLDASGNWVAASSNKTVSKDINNNGSFSPGNQSASFRLPRMNGQLFRVRVFLREADPNSSDYNKELSFVHQYNPSSVQLYAPESGSYTSWSSSTKIGKQVISVNVRDRTWALGILIGEGCQFSATYTVRIQQL